MSLIVCVSQERSEQRADSSHVSLQASNLCKHIMFMFFVVSEVDYFEILLLVHEDEHIFAFYF